MKTIKEWLEELPEPYRTQAIDNMNQATERHGLRVDLIEEESLSKALCGAFSWALSKEGASYWSYLYEMKLNKK